MDKSVFKAKYYEFAGFCLDESNRELLRDGEHVRLTQKCFSTLLFLIQNKSRMLQKEEILNSVWQENFVEEANLAQHIYMIRKAFRNAGESRKLIETIPKYGYRFVGEVTERSGQVSAVSNVSNQPTASYLIEDHWFQSDASGLDQKPAKTGIQQFSFKPFSTSFAVTAAIVLAILAITYLAYSYAVVGTKVRDIGSIAVIPFENIEGTTDKRVVRGLTSVLANRLNEQGRVSVTPALEKSTEVGIPKDPVSVGKKLLADAVLYGSLHRANDAYHITVRLVMTDSKETIWSGDFDSGDGDLLLLPETISRQVADGLNLELKGPTIAERIFDPPEMLDAFSSYAVGVHYFEKSGTENLEKSIDYLSRAVETDPGFAAAAANLADAYSLTGYNRVPGFDPSESISKAKIYAKRAMSLNPGSSQAHSALAMVALFDGDLDRARSLFEKSVLIQPDNARARLRLAWLLSSQDNLAGAIVEMRLALRTKPQSTRINISLARLLRLNRQADEALKYCKRALKLDPSQNGTRVILAEIYEQKGQLDQSVKELESVPKDAPEGKAANLLLGRVYAKKGKKGEAIRILRDVESTKSDIDSSYEVATIYAILGNNKRAVEELQATRDHSLIHYLHLKYDYNIDSIRKSPDYAEILNESSKKLGSREVESS